MEHNVQVIPVTYLNLILGLLIIVYSAYYLIRGRKLDKPMMMINLFVGVWTSIAIALILYDRIMDDIFPEQVTRWIISITMFLVLSTKLANILRIGRKQNGIG
jgi:hypothetical protein